MLNTRMLQLTSMIFHNIIFETGPEEPELEAQQALLFLVLMFYSHGFVQVLRECP
jgi:hypothetical protein